MSKDIKEHEICEAECIAALSALAKVFRAGCISESEDENYNIGCCQNLARSHVTWREGSATR